MLSKSNDYISISLSEDTLKVAQLKGTGVSSKIINAVVKDVANISDVDLPKVIQSALFGMNAKKSNIISVLPLSTITTKNIEIPSVNNEEIQSIVSLQAGRHTPFSRDEIQIGYVNIGVYNNNYTKVLLVIANRNVIKKQIKLFEKAGIKIDKVIFSPEGVSKLYSNGLNLIADTAPTGIIDIDKQSTNFIVTFKGTVITSRSIPIGKSQLDSDPKYKEDLIEELMLTMESYKNEEIEQLPSKYFFTSEDDNTKTIQPMLQEKLSGSVTISPYVDIIKASRGALKKLAVNVGDYSFLDIIATAANINSCQVELIPEEVIIRESIKKQSSEVFRTAILAFITMILIVVGMEVKINIERNKLNKLVDNYSGIKGQVMALEKLTNKTSIIRNYIENRMIALNTINELYRNIPDEVYLTNIFMGQDGNISIQGISEIASIVFNLGTTLKDSELFKSVDIKSTTSKKDRGKDATAFEITLKLKSFANDDKTKNLEE